MRMYLTKGMFGPKVDRIGGDFATMEECHNALANWKRENINNDLYKIERYDRYVFDKEENCTAIDFGDYSYFILIEGTTDVI